MLVETARLLARLHQWIGWGAFAALLVPAVLLANRARRFPVVVMVATLVTTLAGGLGAFIYPTYSRVLRRAIYVASPSHGLLFERKEHLAFAAIALAWVGALLHLRAHVGEGALSRARAAHFSFIGAALLVGIVAVLGTMVASVRTF